MNEAAARQVLLVRAVESTDAPSSLLTEEDRRYAGRSAAELARWQAAERGEPPSAEVFVAKRAELLVAKLCERTPRVRRLLDAMRFHPWTGVALPAIALALGILADRITDPGRVSILAFPLFGIIVWNLAVYVVMIARAVRKLTRRTVRRATWIERLLAGVRENVFLSRTPRPLTQALARFGLDWSERSMPLVAARAGRILHLCAAAIALGAVAGLFLRGLVLEYRAGWESTFLGAHSVHALVTLFLGPAAWLIGEPLPSLDAVAGLRWRTTGGGENAGRWIVLYAVTVAIVVIAPRLLLSAIARLRERRLAEHFPLKLDDTYFRRVLAQWRESPAQVRVQPYAYSANEAASEAMQRLAILLFGDSARVYWARTVAFGEEDMLPDAPDRASQRVDLLVALFNLSATPETENHGLFLDRLRSSSSSPLVIMVDQSAYRERLGTQAGADARLAERRDAWRAFTATHGLDPIFVDLAGGDLTPAQKAVEARLAASSA